MSYCAHLSGSVKYQLSAVTLCVLEWKVIFCVDLFNLFIFVVTL